MHIFQFPWKNVEDNLFVFLVPEACTSSFAFAFGLGATPGIFTKLLNLKRKILHRINIKIKIYLEDMLLIGHTL